MNNIAPELLNSSALAKRALQLSQQLIRFASVTPADAGSFAFVWQQLTQLGFSCEDVSRDGVRNLVASRSFGVGATLAFAGHLDVVPAGTLTEWRHPPFAAVVEDGWLYGRGAADMKGAIGCFLAATEALVQQCSRGRLMFLLTWDEEGDAEHGTAAIMQYLQQQRPELLPDFCLVGEPTCRQQLGDVIKIGRRGSLSAAIRFFGLQGHVAYPANCDNAAHHAATLATQLLAIKWDTGTAQLPGSSLQVTRLDSGDFTDNVVPGTCDLNFNIRYSSCYQEAELKTMVELLLQQLPCRVELEWQRPCWPYFNEADKFVSLTRTAIAAVTGVWPQLSTDGGTSDGRFIASAKTQVIEFGLRNNSIHQHNESVRVTELGQLAAIYRQLIGHFCGQWPVATETAGSLQHSLVE